MTRTTTPDRPATVTAAALLMTVAAAGYLLSSLVLLGQIGTARRSAAEVLGEAGFPGRGMLTFVQVAVVATALLTSVAAVVLLGAARAVRAGSRPGRITAWVTMGLLLLCGLSGAARAGLPDFGGNVSISLSSSDGATTRQYTGALPALYGDAYRISTGVFSVLALIALLTATVLLTRPSAGRWFDPVPVPSGPPAGYVPGPVIEPTGYGPGPFAVGRLAGPAAAADDRLARLVRRHQRGELTDAEFAAERYRLTGS